tara:strand:+ start:6988 stop:7263 length:276 start_codon:yes stop_codon:yes gene_type:complete
MITKLNPHGMSADLLRVKAIHSAPNSMETYEVCDLYIKLCEAIGKGIVEDEVTGDIIKRMELRDNQDRPHRHNVNPANRPSLVQELYKDKK